MTSEAVMLSNDHDVKDFEASGIIKNTKIQISQE